MADDPATKNLRLAYTYLKSFEAKFVGVTRKDNVEAEQLIRFIGKHLEIVSKLNPHATISVVEEKNTVTYTFDELAGFALYYEAALNNNPDTPFYELYRSEQALKKSASYQKQNPHPYFELAKIYTRQFERQKALGALKQALDIDPDYFPAIDLLNKLQDNPRIGQNIHKKRDLALYLEIFASMTGLAFLYGIFFSFFGYGDNSRPNLDNYLFWGFLGLIAFLYAQHLNRTVEKDETFKQQHHHHPDEL